MRLDRFTSKFQIAISDAQSLALGRDHQYIEPVHLMVALMDQNGSPIRPLLTMLSVDVSQLRSKLGEMLDRLPKVSGIGGDVQLSGSMGTLFNLCDKVAQKRQDTYISSEIFLLAAIEDRGPLGALLKEFGDFQVPRLIHPQRDYQDLNLDMVQQNSRRDVWSKWLLPVLALSN